MELLLLLVILPAVQDQNQGREWLKYLVQRSAFCNSLFLIFSVCFFFFLGLLCVIYIHGDSDCSWFWSEQNDQINNIPRWCEGVSWILSLQSYMFGDSQEAVQEVEARGEDDEEELGEVMGILFSFLS